MDAQRARSASKSGNDLVLIGIDGRSTIVFSPSASGSEFNDSPQRLSGSPWKAIMNFGPRSIAFGALFCISSLLAVAQQTPCSTDGQTPAPGAIACVTGNGVIVTANTPVDAPQEVMPLTPEQRPAAPPIVIYLNGKLSISAKNSTLGDVLRAIANKTGAAIDVPENANERVVSQLGPAPARDVMASLLNGSHFNYVMVGSENDPNSVVRVVLTAKSEKGEHRNCSGSLVEPGHDERTSDGAAPHRVAGRSDAALSGHARRSAGAARGR